MRPDVTDGRAFCRPSKISCLADRMAAACAWSGSSSLTSNKVLPNDSRWSIAKMNSGSSCRGCQPEVPVMVGTVPDPPGGPDRRGELPGSLRRRSSAVWPGSPRSLTFRCGRLGGEPAAHYPAPAAVDHVDRQGSDAGERSQRAQEAERPGHGDPKRPPAGAEATRQAG